MKGYKNSDTPTCRLWCHAVCTELGKERIRSLRRLRPQEAINRSCPVCFVAADKCPECTARKGQDDNTAIRPRVGVLPPLKSQLVENGRKPVRSNVSGRISHKPEMAAGLKGQAKTDMKS